MTCKRLSVRESLLRISKVDQNGWTFDPQGTIAARYQAWELGAITWADLSLDEKQDCRAIDCFRDPKFEATGLDDVLAAVPFGCCCGLTHWKIPGPRIEYESNKEDTGAIRATLDGNKIIVELDEGADPDKAQFAVGLLVCLRKAELDIKRQKNKYGAK